MVGRHLADSEERTSREHVVADVEWVGVVVCLRYGMNCRLKAIASVRAGHPIASDLTLAYTGPKSTLTC